MLSCTDVVPRFFQLFLECAHSKVTIVPKRDAQIAIDSADLVLGIRPLDRSRAVTRPCSVRTNLLEDARPFRFLSFDWEELTPDLVRHLSITRRRSPHRRPVHFRVRHS